MGRKPRLAGGWISGRMSEEKAQLKRMKAASLSDGKAAHEKKSG
jgi:hypothetical protein